MIRERNICRFIFILVRLWKFYSLEEGNSFNSHSVLVFPDYNGNCMKSKFIFYKVEAGNFDTFLRCIAEMN